MLNINRNELKIDTSYQYNNLSNAKMVTNEDQSSTKSVDNDTVEISKQGKSKLQGLSESDSNSSSSTTNLSSLSSSELQKLVSNGTITQAEANAELLKRSNSSDEAESNTSQNSKMMKAIEAYKVYEPKMVLN